MKKEVYLTILFDYYEKLLTEQQRKYFVAYYFDNLSLGEISENMNVSRNAVHKQLKVIEEKLEEYENILHIYEKDRKLEMIINSISDKDVKSKLEEIIK